MTITTDALRLMSYAPSSGPSKKGAQRTLGPPAAPRAQADVLGRPAALWTTGCMDSTPRLIHHYKSASTVVSVAISLIGEADRLDCRLRIPSSALVVALLVLPEAARDIRLAASSFCR